MTYFDKKRSFTAYLVGVKPKNTKLAASTDEGHAETKLCLFLTLDIPLTKAMKTCMSPVVQSWITANAAAKGDDETLEKAIPKKLQKVFYALIQFFDEGAKEPVKITPNESGDRTKAQCQITRYFIQAGEPFAQIKITVDFDTVLWNWLGTHLQHSSNAVEIDTKPLQESLPGTV